MSEGTVVKRDVVDAIESLLAHRTEDLGCYEFVLEAWMEEAASEIKRLRSERRWIPVSEQLPQRGEMVIVAFRGHWGGKRQVSAEVFWIDDRGGWTGCDSMKDGKPTHWMPLPEPPA